MPKIISPDDFPFHVEAVKRLRDTGPCIRFTMKANANPGSLNEMQVQHLVEILSAWRLERFRTRHGLPIVEFQECPHCGGTTGAWYKHQPKNRPEETHTIRWEETHTDNDLAIDAVEDKVFCLDCAESLGVTG